MWKTPLEDVWKDLTKASAMYWLINTIITDVLLFTINKNYFALIIVLQENKRNISYIY